MLPNEDKKCREREREGDEQDTADEIFYRFRPLAFCRHVAEQAQKQESEKDRRDYVTSVVRSAVRGIVNRPIAISVIAVVGTVIFVAWLATLEILTANQTVALFTGMLFTAATVQFIATGLQWQTMRKQLDYMNLGRRAWLTVVGVTVKPIKQGVPVRYSLQIANTGSTPGRIIAGTIQLTVRDADISEEQIVKEFEDLGFRQHEQFTVPPGKEVTVNVSNSPILPDSYMQGILSETMQLHVLCRMRYLDVMGDAHHIKAFYTLNVGDGGLYLRNNYGSMD